MAIAAVIDDEIELRPVLRGFADIVEKVKPAVISVRVKVNAGPQNSSFEGQLPQGFERFFRRYEATITVQQAQGMQLLMDLSDNDLMDLLLARKEPSGDLDRAEVHEVLGMMRTAPLHTQG